MGERISLERILKQRVQSEQANRSIPDRASEASRRQRAGTEFIGGYGTTTGDSDLRFIEGQLPEHEERVESDKSPAQHLELALQNLEAKLNQHGQGMDDMFQLTLHLTDMGAYESVNETYERYIGAGGDFQFRYLNLRKSSAVNTLCHPWFRLLH